MDKNDTKPQQEDVISINMQAPIENNDEKTSLLYPDFVNLSKNSRISQKIAINENTEDLVLVSQQPLPSDSDPPLQFTKVVGYISFAIVFNVLNTIIYGTLYPKILEYITPKYAQVFSNTNLSTTLFSALLLPIIGSIADQRGATKSCLVVCQFMGIAVTYGFMFLTDIPSGLQVLWAEFLYILAMFLLRTAILGNNSQISCFPVKYRTLLSLSNNLAGFVVNLGGLLALRYAKLPSSSRWTPELCWLGIFSILVTIVSPLVFFGPSPQGCCKPEERPSVFTATKRSFLAVVKTLRDLVTLNAYKGIMYFLFSYVFFSAAGSMFTLFISTFFISVYSLDTPEEVLLNLYYKIAMITGTAFGMVLNRFVKVGEVTLLVIQTAIFCFSGVAMYITVIADAHILYAYSWAMLIGANYAWSSGVSRGLMAKLIPPGKVTELMALYSTATYIPITVVSSVYSASLKAGLHANVLPLLLSIFVLPAFVLLFKTNQYCTMKNTQR